MLVVDGYGLWRCRGCRSLTIHPRPDAGPGDLYDEQYFSGGHGRAGYSSYDAEGSLYSRSVYQAVRGRLLDAFPRRGTLLDIGCATGALVDAATVDGWDATGTDVGRFVVDRGRARGLNLRAGTIRQAGLPEAHFDVITTLHTVEHLPDPVGDLREARRIAKAGAMLVVEVPNARSLGFLVRRERWSQLKPPEHINFFGPSTLAALLRRTGWRPTDWETIYFTDVAVDIATAGRPVARRVLGTVARAGEKMGAVRAIERLGFGGYLRMFARADGD